MPTAWERVQIARDTKRATAQFFINNVFDDFIELHGDRNFGDDSAIIGGIGTINQMPFTVIAEEKGTSLEDKTKRNFGCPHPEGYRKALRLMKQAEKFKRPIICFVDTQGAYCGVGAEERGQGEAIAKNLLEMMNLTVPVLAFVIGEGGSGGALAIAVANKVYMLENSIYSILSPEGFASILWKDSTRAEEAAEVMKMTANDLLNLNIIDGIISEDGDSANIANNIREKIIEDIKELKQINNLSEHRYNRFRKF